jgi:hypothetical protein
MAVVSFVASLSQNSSFSWQPTQAAFTYSKGIYTTILPSSSNFVFGAALSFTTLKITVSTVALKEEGQGQRVQEVLAGEVTRQGSGE